MTEVELKALVPHESIIYSKDKVGYTFMGYDKEGKCLLCGMSFSYEPYLIMDNFFVKKGRI